MTVTFPAAAKRTADPRCHNQSYYLRRAIHRHAILTRQDFRGVLSRLALACGVDPASIATSVYPIDQRPILHDVRTALIAERTAFLARYRRYIQQRRSEKRSGGAQPRHADLQCLYAPAYLDPRCTPLLPL